MSKVTYLTPRATGPAIEETGDSIRLTIGTRPVRFVLQHKGGREDVADLVHYASGMIAVNSSTLNAYAIDMTMRGNRVTLRQCAEYCLRRIEHSIGADELLGKLNAAPVLNK